MREKGQTTSKTSAQTKPPVVVVMGHVDHGKTTLLDTIRKTNVAAKEHGAITQHIGAYQVTLPPVAKVIDRETPSVVSSGSNDQTESAMEGQPQQKVTFIDTPGHEAFTAMRTRGANVADIAILVVAADDSVKPQTLEAIKIIKEAGIPMIVGINKIDLPTANVDKVKQDLAKNEVYVEGYGGDTVVQELAAKTGKGVPELLELISLVSQMEELTSDATLPLSAVVIESKLDKGRGPVATVVVQQGSLTQGKEYYIEGKKFKVRALIDDHGQQIKDAGPAFPCEVIGLASVPKVGAVIEEQFQEAQTKEYSKGMNLMEAFAMQNKEVVPVLVKADATGSLEAITQELEKFAQTQESPTLRVVQSQIGDIAESDILYGKATQAIVLGFNVKISPQARTLAQVEGIPYKIYTLIYELLDDVSALLEIGLSLKEEKPKGEAHVMTLFPTTEKIILGVKVNHGRLRIGEAVKIIRESESLGSGKIKTMRHLKDDVKEITNGMEAGIVIDTDIEIQPQDVLQYSP